MTALGLTPERVAARWSALLDARRQVPIVHAGRVVDVFETDDFATQLRAADALTEMLGGYPAKRLDVSGAFRVEQLHALVDRFDALPTEQLLAMAAGDPSTLQGDIIEEIAE